MKGLHGFSDRLTDSVLVLPLRHLRGRERREAALVMLERRYPATLEGKRVVIIKNGKRTGSSICFVCAPEACDGRTASSTRYLVNRLSGYTGEARFIGRRFVETVRMEDGALVWSYVRARNASVAGNAADAQGDGTHGAEAAGACRTFREEAARDIRRGDLFPAYGCMHVLKRIAVWVAAAAIVSLASAAVFSRHAERSRAAAEARKLFEAHNRVKLAEAEAERQRAEELEGAYRALAAEKNPGTYLTASLIYRCLGAGARIEHLAIAGNTFQLDIHTKDGVAVLANFERERLVEEIRMSRAAQAGASEYVTYSGSVRRNMAHAPLELSDAEKASYYEELLLAEERRKKLMEEVPLSSYAEKVRRLLGKNGCTEEYLQFRMNGGYAELECSLKSGRENMFSFLREAECGEDGIEFAAVRIRTSGSGVQSVVRMNTGIRADAIQAELAYTEEELHFLSVAPMELGKAFYQQPLGRGAASAQKPVAQEPQSPVPKRSVASHLSYVGECGSASGARYVFFKDSREDRLYRLEVAVSAAECAGDFCVAAGGSYEAHIGGIVYEVKR